MITDTPGTQLGLPRDEGLVVAYIPPTGQMPEEYEYRDGARSFIAVAYDNILMDLLPMDRKSVKWWIVREAARALKLAPIEPLWTGPVEDFRVRCLPDVPRPVECSLAMRQYSRGPWIILDSPKQQLDLPFGTSGEARPVQIQDLSHLARDEESLP